MNDFFFSLKQHLHFWQTKHGYNDQKPELSKKEKTRQKVTAP